LSNNYTNSQCSHSYSDNIMGTQNMSYLHVPPFWKLQQCIGYTTCIQYQNFTLNLLFT